MGMCRFVRLLYGLVRWKRFRAFLVRKHMEACLVCSAMPPRGDDWAACVHPPAWVREEGSMWPDIQRRMRENVAEASARDKAVPAAPARRRFPTRLVPAAAGLAAAAVLGIIVWRAGHRTPGGAAPGAGSPRVEVLSAEVEGKEARTSIFQTENASYIWFSRTQDGGGRK